MLFNFSNATAPNADPQLLRSHVEHLTNTKSPRNFENISALNEAADYISKEWKKLEVQVTEQKWTVENKIYKNVIATLGPTTAARVIVGAHYDVAGAGPGADDNASGVAGILELARVLKSRNLQRRVELVAYSLEEPPFFAGPQMGSAVHAKQTKKQGVPVHLMVSLEMIGYFSEKENSQRFPLPAMKEKYPSTGNFIAVAGRVEDVAMTEKIKKIMRRNSRIDVQTINAPSSLPGMDLSDHRSYWAHGIPAVMITDTAFYRNPHYHEKTDTAATLDYTKMGQVIDGVAAIAVQF